MAKTFNWTDVSAHNTRDDCWLVIDKKVYDVTKFLDEHPGGEEVLLEQGGSDSTEAFEEIGHSDDARDLLKKFYLGDLADDGKPPAKAASKVAATTSIKADGKASTTSTSTLLFSLVPVAVAVAFIAYKVLEKA
ncbi:Cytochrome b5 [Phlyctochytrium planicorne]|nr:Cytochrome b5 [Phlyctochytrium planicorne]